LIYGLQHRFAYGLIFAEKIANIQISTDFSGVIDTAKIHMTPLKFQIAVLGTQLFKKGISRKTIS
jgi:hypothetical protein